MDKTIKYALQEKYIEGYWAGRQDAAKEIMQANYYADGELERKIVDGVQSSSAKIAEGIK